MNTALGVIIPAVVAVVTALAATWVSHKGQERTAENEQERILSAAYEQGAEEHRKQIAEIKTYYEDRLNRIGTVHGEALAVLVAKVEACHAEKMDLSEQVAAMEVSNQEWRRAAAELRQRVAELERKAEQE